MLCCLQLVFLHPIVRIWRALPPQFVRHLLIRLYPPPHCLWTLPCGTGGSAIITTEALSALSSRIWFQGLNFTLRVSLTPSVSLVLQARCMQTPSHHLRHV